MEKQYSTYYLPEKYKQHYFIVICNFEITVLKAQSYGLPPRSSNDGLNSVKKFYLQLTGKKLIATFSLLLFGEAKTWAVLPRPCG